MNRVSVAVVVPSYNNVPLLKETVESVISQTRVPDEIIVVDDGSTSNDDLDTVARMPGVRLIRQLHQGAAIARNTGVAAASSDWIMFLDQDDLWHPDKVARVERAISECPSVEALHDQAWFFSAPDGPVEGFGFPRQITASSLRECVEAASSLASGGDADRFSNPSTLSKLIATNTVALSCAAVRRDTLIRAGCFPPSLTDDWRMAVNVARLTTWLEIPERLTFHRLHSSSTTVTTVEGLNVVVAYLDLWLGGSLLQGGGGLGEDVPALAQYAPAYRQMMRSMIWGALRQREPGVAFQHVGLALSLLPRRRDLFVLLLPPELRSRLVRLLWMVTGTSPPKG